MPAVLILSTWQAIALAVGWLLALLLGFLLWSSRSQRPTRVEPGSVEPLPEVLPALQALTEAWVTRGNRVELIENGDGFFPELLRQVSAAESSIHLEVYAWWTGDICRRLATALEERASSGVEVRVLVDALGALKMEDDVRKTLIESSVILGVYHPFQWRSLGRLNKRDHRKLAIFDGKIGYMFGHGIAEEWQGDARDSTEWRDLAARIEGPAVARMQGVFAQNWMEEQGELLASAKYFPSIEAIESDRASGGGIDIYVVSSSPRGGVSDSSILYRLLIGAARKELVIENPYFAPGREVIGLLVDAVKRGVRVRVLVPGEVTDSHLVRHAGHYFFAELLEGGVEIYEFQPTLNHQKVVVVDGSWSYLGSANFDERSFDINAEAGLVLHDESVAGDLLKIFEKDLERSKRRDAREWRRRGAWKRVKERLAFLFHDQI